MVQCHQSVWEGHRSCWESYSSDRHQAHQGASTKAPASGWSRLSEAHVDEIVTGCGILADALDGYAGYIVVQKGEAIAELLALAASFVAEQAAAVETLGLSEAGTALTVGLARKLTATPAQQLQQYAVGKVIDAAKPLFAKIENALSGLDWGKGGNAGAPPPNDNDSLMFGSPPAAIHHPEE